MTQPYTLRFPRMHAYQYDKLWPCCSWGKRLYFVCGLSVDIIFPMYIYNTGEQIWLKLCIYQILLMKFSTLCFDWEFLTFKEAMNLFFSFWRGVVIVHTFKVYKESFFLKKKIGRVQNDRDNSRGTCKTWKGWVARNYSHKFKLIHTQHPDPQQKMH